MWNLFKRNKLENENIDKKDYNAVIVKNTSEVSVKEAQDTSKSKLLIERDTIVEAENRIKKNSEQGKYKAVFTFRNKLDDPKMLLFFKYFTEKGFSVSIDCNGYTISWEKQYNQVQPSDPRFINKELEDSFYNLLTYHTSYSYLLTISDFQFDKDNVSDEADLECILKVQPVSIGGQKATTLLSTKGVTYTYPAEDVWKNLMRVKTFLSAYNNKYGTNTSK